MGGRESYVGMMLLTDGRMGELMLVSDGSIKELWWDDASD
jgi:hypothetical protein